MSLRNWRKLISRGCRYKTISALRCSHRPNGNPACSYTAVLARCRYSTCPLTTKGMK